MSNETLEILRELSQEDKQKTLEYVELLKSHRKGITSDKIQPEISDITSLFKQLPARSQREALAAMEHISEYENMDFWGYQNKVYEMSCDLDRLKKLFSILDGFFNCGESEFVKNKIERAMFLRSYAKMQALIHDMWDIVVNAAEVADALSSVDIHESERVEDA